MSDLYGSNEAEDMSCFLQILLQNPLSSAAASETAAAGGGGLFSGGGAAAETPTTFNFSDPGCFYSTRESDRINPSFRVKNLASSSEELEACDVASNLGSSRSLKRSRDSEVHNLSEKRRRSRINEKLKALLTLIPNSNKTDKASMLDEAIEYLKQLQLQVQTLTIRNGVSLHPGYSMGPLSATLAQYSARLDMDEGPPITNRVTGTLLRDPNVYMQSMVPQRTNHNPSTLPMLMLPSIRNTDNGSGILPSYGMLDHLASAKDICRDDTSSRLQLDFGGSGNTSSPGISS